MIGSLLGDGVADLVKVEVASVDSDGDVGRCRGGDDVGTGRRGA